MGAGKKNHTRQKNKPARSEGEQVLGANRAGVKTIFAADPSSTDFFRHFEIIGKFVRRMTE
jgi:hypothetical protein